MQTKYTEKNIVQQTNIVLLSFNKTMCCLFCFNVDERIAQINIRTEKMQILSSSSSSGFYELTARTETIGLGAFLHLISNNLCTHLYLLYAKLQLARFIVCPNGKCKTSNETNNQIKLYDGWQDGFLSLEKNFGNFYFLCHVYFFFKSRIIMCSNRSNREHLHRATGEVNTNNKEIGNTAISRYLCIFFFFTENIPLFAFDLSTHWIISHAIYWGKQSEILWEWKNKNCIYEMA